ncbi:Cytochrome c [Bosea sp. 62]|uniref:c-type cytochrome n=1 Tax=unclassified Bosea (in: a-proteobacteria) TaxID=2653178 RepID=UPI001254BB1B|nr:MULTISPECIES: c-type cytochrome [unclassified Bosea (in: a-proteobacteria)]CAD5287713.1 Cytochrome c [Bosea sp. 21B]CAD5290031.1 Cytochrome c [Bosea sp. 46]CAD5301000.1 Cytochrome c [Bosea sp. 7B]VVT60430.1 Cytochrome c [Bosea sp. EC-HK365B]VXA99961.1 Cytochrome c [Bosea sp. 62]
MRAASAALIAFGLIAGGAVRAQEPAGAAIFKACQSCHSLDPAKTGMAGPHLAGLNGRVLGSAEEFDYSPAFKAAKAQGLKWDRERLLGYLADPDAVVQGGWMSPPAGLSTADRAAVADYLLKQ